MNADRIFKNGKIYTVNENKDWAEAVAVKDGKIVFVGSDKDALSYEGKNTDIVDLDGRLMMPGFIDSHCHPVLAAYFLSGVYLEIDYSVDENLDAIKAFVKEEPQRSTYFGLGYAEWIFDEKGPKKEMLDDICSEKPMLILGSSGHEGWCNTKALEMAGVDENTPDPVPGFQYFERDEHGKPTGHLVETGPLLTLIGAINPFPPGSIEENLKKISAEYAAMGVTSIVDCGSFAFMVKNGMELYKEMTSSGEFVQRVTDCGGHVSELADIEGKIDELKALREKYNSDRYRVGYLKIINDGTIESRSAALFEPYDEDGSLPDTLFTVKELTDMCLDAAKADFDIIIHGIGDKAINDTLMAAKAVREAGYKDIRITNAHTDYVRPEDRELFSKYDVIANTTLVWHYGNPNMNKVIGDRADEQFMLKSLLDRGAVMSLGSDFPVDEYGREPLKGIEMGITRKLYGRPDWPVLLPENEKLTVAQCVEGYTMGSASQNRNEDKIGSVETGKYADLVILDQNIFETDAESIHKATVYMTVINGEVVYREQ